MCLTCKSTVMVVTNHTSICKVANTKSPQLEYVARILLFAIFFHLRFIFSRNILHETYIQKHKRVQYFLSKRGWNALFLTICFIQIFKNVSYNCYIPPNKQSFTSTWNNCAKLSKRLWLKYKIVCNRIICFFWEKFCKKICSLHKTYLKKNYLSK